MVYETIRFIGVDLAWSERNPTGLCLISLDARAELQENSNPTSNEEIVGWILEHAPGSAIVAIDAPLIIKNQMGARQVDKLVTKYFRKYEAGALPANLGNASRGMEILRLLCKEGFSYDPEIIPRRPTRTVIEVFPHTTQVILFKLEKTLKYKRGRIEEKKRELARLQRYIETLTEIEPIISRNAVFDKICSSEISKMKGKGLKNHEDLLDAIICAYTAYYYWYWGNRKCNIFGDKENGYIVTPINDILRSQIDGSVSST